MRDELLEYYERELTYLRQMGAEFSEKYPKVASRLLLDPNRCEDPHVERLIEAFAFLAARVHLKIDDEFPEITEALLSVLYPHYIRPIPSSTIVQFHLDPEQGKLSTGLPDPAWLDALLSAHRRLSLQIQNLFRHHALAAKDCHRSMGHARPLASRRQVSGRRRRTPPGTRMFSRRLFR